jgi:hypothetical protein
MLRRFDHKWAIGIILKKKNCGFICPYALVLRAEGVNRVTQQTGNHHGRSRTATSCSQQQVRMKTHCHRWGSNLRSLAC